MNAHDLGRLLLEGPDLPVITANHVDLELINGIEPWEPEGPHTEGWWDGNTFNREPAVCLW